jgi:hypothetical protein
LKLGKSEIMKIRKISKLLVAGSGVLVFAGYSATCQDTISLTGTSGTTYAGNDTGQGSANKGREIYSATIANDANNLYITLALNPGGNSENQGNFDYLMVITSGNPSAGGDTEADVATGGNAYDRAISIDSGFGGMTDMIGIFGAGPSGANGSAAHPFTSYGFNDWIFSGGSWVQVNNYATGGTIVNGPMGNPTEISFTVPFSDLSNLNWTPGSTFDFDFDATGSGTGQTAYGDLVLPGPVQGGTYYVNGNSMTGSGTYSATYQFNETTLDQYTVAAVPEPGLLPAAGGLCGLFLAFLQRQRKQNR